MAQRRTSMMLVSKWRDVLVTLMFLAAITIVLQGQAVAEDPLHHVTGVVKDVDKNTKTMVVKAADGTEHTFKYSEKTSVEGAKDVGKETEKGSKDTAVETKKGAKVTVDYTEKAGEKTAVGVKDAVK
jgi:hypothetical protein